MKVLNVFLLSVLFSQLAFGIAITSRDAIHCIDKQSTTDELVVSRHIKGVFSRRVTYKVHKIVKNGKTVFSRRNGRNCGKANSAWSLHINVSCTINGNVIRFEDMNAHDNGYVNGNRIEKCAKIPFTNIKY